MEAALTRRQALIGATAGLLAAGWPRLAPAQGAAGALTLTDLAPDLVLVSGAGANVVALATADGLLLVDGGAEAHAAALQRALARALARPPRRGRVQHQLARRAYGRERARCAAPARRSWRTRTRSSGSAATFSSSGRTGITRRARRDAADQDVLHVRQCRARRPRVEYWHLPRAHTDGDVAVFFPDANVLVASDLLSVGRYPVPDYATGGWIGGLVDATQKLLDYDGCEDAHRRRRGRRLRPRRARGAARAVHGGAARRPPRRSAPA